MIWKPNPSDEWWTPPEFAQAVRDVLGQIDLDPASCADANEIVQARLHYTKPLDGLAWPWYGRVYLNPPYGQLLPFIRHLLAEYKAGRTEEAIVVTYNGTETRWCQELLAASSAVCFVKGKIRFVSDRPPSDAGLLRGHIISYLGKRPGLFVQRFSAFGVCRSMHGKPLTSV